MQAIEKSALYLLLNNLYFWNAQLVESDCKVKQFSRISAEFDLMAEEYGDQWKSAFSGGSPSIAEIQSFAQDFLMGVESDLQKVGSDWSVHLAESFRSNRGIAALLKELVCAL